MLNIASLLTLIVSASTSLATPMVYPRAAAFDSIELCHNTLFQGQCTTEFNLGGGCRHVLPPDVGQISSVWVWPGTQCILFRDPGCIGSGLVVPNGGIADLGAYGWNDIVVSFTCFPA